MRLFFNFLLIVGFVCTSYGQNVTIEKAKIDNAYPDKDQILAALNGGGLKLSDGKLEAGVVDGHYGHSGSYPLGEHGSQVVIFSDGLKAGFGMDTGVLFSTGNAITDLSSKNVSGGVGHTFYKNSYDGGEVTDADLMGIYSTAVNDVVIYTFKVKLNDNMNSLRVAFQFGSEEYPDYVATPYNDAFGFFVKGPNLPENGVNMAVIPNSGDVTSVNTINNGFKGVNSATYPAEYVSINSPFYLNNGHTDEYDGYTGTLRQNGNDREDLKNIFIEYNGLTKLLTYDLVGLEPGGVYDFKIAIADSGDPGYDSGVMIHKIQGTTGADLVISKEVDNMKPNVGDVIEFTLTGSNIGPHKGTEVKVNDLLPNGYDFISADATRGNYDPETGVWTIGSIEKVHDFVKLKVKARVKSSGNYTNTAKISGKEEDPDPTNNEDEVTPDVQKPAAIGLVKIGEVDDTVDGTHGNGIINYTFTITNIGNVPLKGIRLVDTKLPVDTVYNYSGDTNNNNLLDTDEIWTATATYNVTDADIEAEKVENRATVYGTSPRDKEVSAKSKDEQGFDNPTITPVEGGGPLMTNPHIYHKVQ